MAPRHRCVTPSPTLQPPRALDSWRLILWRLILWRSIPGEPTERQGPHDTAVCRGQTAAVRAAGCGGLRQAAKAAAGRGSSSCCCGGGGGSGGCGGELACVRGAEHRQGRCVARRSCGGQRKTVPPMGARGKLLLPECDSGATVSLARRAAAHNFPEGAHPTSLLSRYKQRRAAHLLGAEVDLEVRFGLLVADAH